MQAACTPVLTRWAVFLPYRNAAWCVFHRTEKIRQRGRRQHKTNQIKLKHAAFPIKIIQNRIINRSITCHRQHAAPMGMRRQMEQHENPNESIQHFQKFRHRHCDCSLSRNPRMGKSSLHFGKRKCRLLLPLRGFRDNEQSQCRCRNF